MTKCYINFNDHKILIPKESFGELDPCDPLSLGSASAYQPLHLLFSGSDFKQFKIDCSKIFLSRWFRAEVFVAEVYTRLCQLVTDESVLATFKEIIEEELTHANIVFNIYKHTYNEEPTVEMKSIEINDVGSTAFSMVFYETMATALMHTYYDLTTNTKIRQLFKKILADDVGHANNLIGLYNNYGIDRLTAESEQVKLLIDDCINNPGDFGACFQVDHDRRSLVMDHLHLLDQSVQSTTFKKYFKKDINRWFNTTLI